MRNIAFVEDDDGYAKTIEKFLQRYGKENGEEIRTVRFADAEKFLSSYSPVYDIIFLDIELPLMDGMTLAEEIRKKDSSTVIIFLTHMANLACKGYGVNAMDFIVKPIAYPDFALKLQKGLRIAGSKKDAAITIPSGKGFVRLALSELVYVETRRHDVYYHLKGDVMKRRGTMQEAERVLLPHGFLKCNQCYLVNPAFVVAVDGYNVKVGDDWLQISQPKKRDFMTALTKYLSGNE